MMRVPLFFSLLLTGILLLGACKSQKEKEKAPEQTKDSLTIEVQNAPEWAVRPPSQEGLLYAVGQASSLRPEIARRKAMLNARIKLAEKLNQQGDSLDFLLRWSRVKEEKQIKQGKRWHSFVLMELPLQKKTQP